MDRKRLSEEEEKLKSVMTLALETNDVSMQELYDAVQKFLDFVNSEN